MEITLKVAPLQVAKIQDCCWLFIPSEHPVGRNECGSRLSFDWNVLWVEIPVFLYFVTLEVLWVMSLQRKNVLRIMIKIICKYTMQIP